MSGSCRMPSARGCLAQSHRRPATQSPARPGGKSCPLAPARPAVASAPPHAPWPVCSSAEAGTCRWRRQPVRLGSGPRPASLVSLPTAPTGGTSAPGRSAPSPAEVASSTGITPASDPRPRQPCWPASASTCLGQPWCGAAGPGPVPGRGHPVWRPARKPLLQTRPLLVLLRSGPGPGPTSSLQPPGFRVSCLGPRKARLSPVPAAGSTLSRQEPLTCEAQGGLTVPWPSGGPWGRW